MNKKINAIMAMMTAFMAADHVAFNGMLLMGKTEYNPKNKIFGIILLCLFSLHAVISIVTVMYKKKSKIEYFKLNKGTALQRDSSLFMLAFLVIHFIHFTNMNNIFSPSFLFFAAEMIFVILIGIHMFISLGKALLSLGIWHKWTEIMLKSVLVLMYLFASYSEIVYFVGLRA